jgi:hypothetical protein
LGKPHEHVGATCSEDDGELGDNASLLESVETFVQVVVLRCFSKLADE